MATTATRQLVRLTNISNQNLGFKSPLKFLLRGEQLNFEPRLCTKVIYDDQVDANMRQWEADGLLKIEPFKPKEKTAKAATTVTKKDTKKSPAEGLKGDPQKPGFENLSKDDPPNLDLNITDKAPKPTDKADVMAENPPAPTDGTVASGFDGQPTTADSEKNASDADDDDDDVVPPTLTEEMNTPLPDPGVIYAREELDGMKMSDVRRVVESKKIEAKSTQKDVLAQAIIEHQESQGAEDAST
jgi:hypothetical protein